MKTNITFPNCFLILALLAFTQSLFSQRFEWVNFTPVLSGNANGGSGSQALTRDAAGYLYTLATLSEAVIAGADTIYPFYPGSTDIYLTKWDAQGHVVWAKPFGGNWFDDGRALAYQSVDNRIIATSYIQGPVTVMADTTYDNASDYQMIVFDTAGNFVTTRFLGWSNCSMAAKDSVIYCTYDWGHLIRYDPDGTIHWTLSPSSSNGSVYFTSVAITAQYDVLMAGIFGTSFVIGQDTVNSGPSSTGDHSFLIKADSSGQILFAKYIGSLGLTYYNTIPVCGDEEGNSYISDSYLQSDLVFGNDTLPVLSSGNGAFVAKFNASGDALWGKYFYGTGDTRPYGLLCKGNNIFVCGSYSGSMIYGSDTISAANFGLEFVGKLNTEGDYLYVKEAGSYNGTSNCNLLVSDNNDHYYMDGLAYSSGTNSTFGCFTQSYSDQYLTEFKDTLNILPEVTISQVSNLLYADYACACSIQWYLDDEPVAGGTVNPLSITENGTYYAIVQDDYNCSAQSNSITVVNALVSLSVEPGFIVSPNPFNSELCVNFQQNSRNPYELTLLDLTGRKVFEVAVAAGTNHTEMNTIRLDKGIYILRTEIDGKKMLAKEIKQ